MGEARGASVPGQVAQNAEHAGVHRRGFVGRELHVDHLSVSQAGPDWSTVQICQQCVGRGLVMTPRSPARMPSLLVRASSLTGSFIRWPWETTSLSGVQTWAHFTGVHWKALNSSSRNAAEEKDIWEWCWEGTGLLSLCFCNQRRYKESQAESRKTQLDVISCNLTGNREHFWKSHPAFLIFSRAPRT